MLTGAAPAALSGDWDDFVSALAVHGDSLRRFVRERSVQTNETQRCVALLPAFLTLSLESGLPLDLLELGPSAGLNLLLDSYHYRYAEGTFGDPAAALGFGVVERGCVPGKVLAAPLPIRARRGIDLAPLDVTSDEDVVLLHSFLWPGLDERARRLDAAIETFRASPTRPELIRGDYVEVLPDLLEERDSAALTVVFQTASTAYLSRGRYDDLRAALDRAGSDGRPLAWISSRRPDERESDRDDCWELELRLWPGPTRLVARVDYHGNWVDWPEAAA